MRYMAFRDLIPSVPCVSVDMTAMTLIEWADVIKMAGWSPTVN